MLTSSAVSFAWGFAEATLFFVAPDVWLTALVCLKKTFRELKRAIAWATFGAMVGGLLMYQFGHVKPELANNLLGRIPGMDTGLVENVRLQLQGGGIFALIIGGIKGIPFKIYATQWGIQSGSILLLAGTTIIARGLRFLLSVAVAAIIYRVLPATLQRRQRPLLIWAIFWLIFYWIYFVYVRNS